ncbi:MAG: DUF58 domain-containing protein [Firmicutes bacterium]|nr:DUF58 domain-containing protein [Bacillota bacterium]
MWIRRLTYLLVLLLATIFYVTCRLWFAWYLWVFVLLLLPFDLLISLPGMLTRRVSLRAPRLLEQGEEGKLFTVTSAKKALPSGPIKARLCAKSEDKTLWRRFSLNGACGSYPVFIIGAPHSGVTSFELRRIWPASLLGLFTVPISVRSRATVLVLPAPVKPPHTAGLPRVNLLRPKPGGGFSEEYDLRPYRPGDAVNTIHWKLSAKNDSTIVREALAPPPHSRLIQAAQWTSGGERDLILGRLRWISAYLLEQGLSHYVRLGKQGAVGEITKPEDLTAFLCAALDSESIPAPLSLPAHFTWAFKIDGKVSAAKEGTR